MKNTLKLDHSKRTIVMDRTFAKFATNTMSPEYAHLQSVRQDYPEYTVVMRHIKRKATKECYRGLNYEYMEDYIKTHGSKEESAANLAEYKELKLISKCHSASRRYPTIKKWFLEKYPEVKEFGVSDEEKAKMQGAENEDESVEESYDLTARIPA